MAYVVLAFSAVFDILSLRQSAHQMSVEAQRANRTILDQAVAVWSGATMTFLSASPFHPGTETECGASSSGTPASPPFASSW